MTQALLNAIQGRKQDRYPVWFLRQAGRYLPEYQNLRKGRTFLELCSNPDLAAEVTLQPTKRFDLDAAIIFADILLPLIPLGQELSFQKDHGPVLEPTVRTEADLQNLNGNPDIKSLSYVGEAISKVRASLPSTMSVIGFAGAPFTVASYMIEGGSTKNFHHSKRMAFAEPSTFHKIMHTLNKATLEYLQMQVDAGCDLLMLFDSWAGAMAPEDYESFILPHMKELTGELRKLGKPIIYYPGSNMSHAQMIDSNLCDVLHLDWRISLPEFLKNRPNNSPKCVQGNLDPQTLFLDEEELRKRVRKVVNHFKEADAPSHIFNVGHGLIPQTPIKSLEIVIDELRSK